MTPNQDHQDSSVPNPGPEQIVIICANEFVTRMQRALQRGLPRKFRNMEEFVDALASEILGTTTQASEIVGAIGTHSAISSICEALEEHHDFDLELALDGYIEPKTKVETPPTTVLEVVQSSLASAHPPTHEGTVKPSTPGETVMNKDDAEQEQPKDGSNKS